MVAVDLRGHGASGRGAGPEEYRPEDYADDLVETVPDGVDLAVGHSLGALVLARAVERLGPARAVYCDPAWHLRPGPTGFRPELFVRGKELTREMVRGSTPPGRTRTSTTRWRRYGCGTSGRRTA